MRVDPQLGRFIVRFDRDNVVRETMLLIDLSEGDQRERGGRGRGGRGGGKGGRG